MLLSPLKLACYANEMAFLEDRWGEWKPVSRVAGIAWLCFYVLFLLYAYLDRSGFLILDNVNLIIHDSHSWRHPG